MHDIVMIGATGLVGGEVARRLVAAGHRLTIVGRRSAHIDGTHEVIAAVADWPEAVAAAGATIALSALGTTIRAAGSQTAFAAIDRGTVGTVAHAAKQAGARQWLMVSSVGADPASGNFYLRTKGQAETAVAALGFDRVDIIQPGLLLGERADHRAGEAIAQRLAPLINLVARGPLARYGAVPAGVVAAAMVALAGRDGGGVHRHDNRAIRALARGEPVIGDSTPSAAPVYTP